MQNRINYKLCCWTLAGALFLLVGCDEVLQLGETDKEKTFQVVREQRYSEVLRSGETDKGKPFQVVVERNSSDEYLRKLLIEGEEAILLENQVNIESIQVVELSGKFDVFHIFWQTFMSTGFPHASSDYRYMVVPQGKAAQTILEGRGYSAFNARFRYWYGKGNHTLTFTEDTFMLTEHQWTVLDGSKCEAQEIRLTRRYRYDGLNTTLLSCEQWHREALGVRHPGVICGGYFEEILESTAWNSTEIPEEDGNAIRLSCP